MGRAYEVREWNKWAAGNAARPRYVTDPPRPFETRAPEPRLETHAEVYERTRGHVAAVTAATSTDPGRLCRAWESWISFGKACRGEKWYPCG